MKDSNLDANEDSTARMWRVLDERRAELGIAKRALSQRIGQSDSYFYSGMKRLTAPSHEALSRMMEELGLTRAEVFGKAAIPERDQIDQLLDQASEAQVRRYLRMLEALEGEIEPER